MSGYGQPVQTMITKLLLLAAMLLMPFGMAPAAASAPRHAASAGMPMGHCPDQPSQHRGNGNFGECTMACSTALPAVGGPAVRGPLLIVCEPAAPGLAQRLHSLDTEIATPPPKRS